jgi:CPA2 family monovalent cation:H+ antiporter-2
MFAVGLEFSIHKLVKVGLAGILASLFEVVGMMLVGIGLGRLLGWSIMDSIFLGGMLSISSTMIAIKALEDSGLKEHKFAGYAIGTLIIEDIVAIFLMIILSTVSVSQGISGLSLLETIGRLVFYLALWLLLGIYLLPTFLNKVRSLLNDEMLLVISLGICFGMVWIAAALGFSSGRFWLAPFWPERCIASALSIWLRHVGTCLARYSLYPSVCWWCRPLWPNTLFRFC